MEEKKAINIVWIKRDIRSQDHQPLHLAESCDLPYLIVYFFEPAFINYPDTSLRHLQFQYHSLLQLNKKWKSQGKKVELIYQDALPAFHSILDQFNIKNIFSYQESGIQATYDRDKYRLPLPIVDAARLVHVTGQHHRLPGRQVRAGDAVDLHADGAAVA